MHSWCIYVSFQLEWVLKCHLGGEGPGSDAGQGRAGGADTGDAQQVALPWEAELGKLEGIAQLHQTRELITFFTPLHPPFGIQPVPVPWEQLRCIPW